MKRLVTIVLLGAFLAGCPKTAIVDDAPGAARQPRRSEAAPGSVDARAGLPRLTRADFNRVAALLDLPLFWIRDEKSPGTLEPQELVLLGVATERSVFVRDGEFTPGFSRAYRAMVERRRREAVGLELNQARPTVVHTDLSTAPAYARAVVGHVTRAARIVEELYALQQGSHHLRSCLLAHDAPSHALFRRNQGPWCRAPKTERDPFCNACRTFPARVSGFYPPELGRDPDMCDKLAKHPDAARLLSPFVVVRGPADALEAVPYTREWTQRMDQVAAELKAAAKAISGGEEEAFRAYLLAAARAFSTNDWEPADEAWAAMNAKNSKWYLRIGPDEVYEDPCGRKAAFHAAFARIDTDSLHWQERLTPLREVMESALADLIGSTYPARKVSFHLPDFIQIIINAGDSRSPLGALIGQSLPNWGKVKEEGRSRTVVMSNLYTDPDSLRIRRAQAAALFSKETMKYYTEEKRLALLDIILHEASHNFGPIQVMRIGERTAEDIFGGTRSSLLEELKAQTAAMFYLDLLRERGLLTVEEMNRVYHHAIMWCFGHISRGMFTPSGLPKPYSQVAAIHVATFVREGAMAWEAQTVAANGMDRGSFVIRFEKMPAAVRKLMQRVGRIYAGGDVEGADKLVGELVQGAGFDLVHQAEVRDRILRHPKASFTYSVTY